MCPQNEPVFVLLKVYVAIVYFFSGLQLPPNVFRKLLHSLDGAATLRTLLRVRMRSMLYTCSLQYYVHVEHERNKLLYHITQTDPSFMHLHPFNKFLYILNNESCCQNLIAKCLYKMFKLRSSFLYHS